MIKRSGRPSNRHTVKYGRHPIPFALTYTDSNRLTINVHPDKRVTVKAPQDREIDEIRSRVKRRGSWILKQWRHFERFHPLPVPRKYVSGETHLYLGRRYRLKVRKAREESVKLMRGEILVWSKSPRDSDRTKSLLSQWYANRTRVVLEERIEHCLGLTRKLDITRPEFRLRELKSNWGSCSKNGRITLNTRLVQSPKLCIDYIIVHELCHVRHRSHGPEFWKLLHRVMPDWECRKEKLETLST